MELLEHHIFSVIGDDCEAARTQEPERRLMQFLRVGAQYHDIAHAEMRERADSGANAGGRGQSGRVGDQLDNFLFEAFAACRHHRHAGMDDVVDMSRGEILDRRHQRFNHVLLEVFLVPVLDV